MISPPGIRATTTFLAALLLVSSSCGEFRSDGMPAATDRAGKGGAVGETGGGGKTGGGGPNQDAGSAENTGGAPGGGGPGPTTGGCPSGQHSCNGACVDNLAIEHCGVSCEPCPTVTGGTATCNGTCGITCPAGQKPCNDACIANDTACGGTCPMGKNPCNGICVESKSLNFCGPSCSACPTSADGKASCDGDKCNLECNLGFHKCGDSCVSEKDPKTCGTSCTTACPVPTGGSATCDGSKCGTECPAGTKICAGACIGKDKSCDGMCPGGTHDCEGNCVPNDKTTSCGTGGPAACMPCKPPANADATCDGSKCGFNCRPGYHLCGTECKDNKSVDSCGASACERCKEVANAMPICKEPKGCDFTPMPGFHRCGELSKADDDPMACGSTCKVCPQPAMGKATCVAGMCDVECSSGRKCTASKTCLSDTQPCGSSCVTNRHLCDGTCFPSNDANHCGSSCAPCPDQENRAIMCSSAGRCDVKGDCKSGFFDCSGKCVAKDQFCAASGKCGNGNTPCGDGSNTTCPASCSVDCMVSGPWNAGGFTGDLTMPFPRPYKVSSVTTVGEATPDATEKYTFYADGQQVLFKDGVMVKSGVANQFTLSRDAPFTELRLSVVGGDSWAAVQSVKVHVTNRKTCN